MFTWKKYKSAKRNITYNALLMTRRISDIVFLYFSLV